MFFQPKQVGEMWDTWLYYHDEKHYLFYLHKSDSKMNHWDGMSLAISSDGVHYEEVGPILHKRTDASGMGTGSTWKTDHGFVLNFSESRNGIQSIYFALSTDLVHWNVLGDEYRISPDPRWYDDTSAGRWDCIWTLPRHEGGFYGYLTANLWKKKGGVRFESFGMVESDDGLTWHACPPPVIDWGDWPVMSIGEVGAVERINDRYYLMVGFSEVGLGERQVSGELGLNGGMYLFSSDKPDGPFSPSRKAYRLQVNNATYFTRFYRTPHELLVNHHSIAKRGDGSPIWMPPLKSTVVDEAKDMRLGYWKGNEVCKGRSVQVDFRKSACVFPKNTLEDHVVEERRLQINEPMRGAIYKMDNKIDPEIGAVIEGYITLHPSQKRWGGAGFYLELEEGTINANGIMLETRGQTEFSDMIFSWEDGGHFRHGERVEAGITAGIKHHLRVLSRKTMLEVYLDDLLIQCYTLSAKPSGNWGLICESGLAVFEDFVVWEMNL